MDAKNFEWDPDKDVENFSKHGIWFLDAQHAFDDERRVIVEDRTHSTDEPRYFCFGRVDEGILTVRYTWRSGVIRIIGAGFWRKGKAVYERENSLYR